MDHFCASTSDQLTIHIYPFVSHRLKIFFDFGLDFPLPNTGKPKLGAGQRASELRDCLGTMRTIGEIEVFREATAYGLRGSR